MKAWKRAMLLSGGSVDPLAYTNKVIALSPIAYWPLAELSGATVVDESGNGRNGTYTAVTLAQPGIGDGRTAAAFDGATSFANVYSASLDSAFNNQELTLMCWFRVVAGTWTDATVRCAAHIGVDITNNYNALVKTGTNNQLRARYVAGGTIKSAVFTTAAPTTWQHMALTVSKAADEMKMYIAGTQQGGTQTGLGVWSGALVNTKCTIGAEQTTLTQPWLGNIAHVALWTSALSAAQIATLATV